MRPEAREKHRLACLKWNREHSEEHTRLSAKWRKKNAERHRQYQREHREKYPERERIYNLVEHNLKDYPLDNKCVFCGRTENLEHGHLDYRDEGKNYITVCHQCNCWMERG